MKRFRDDYCETETMEDQDQYQEHSKKKIFARYHNSQEMEFKLCLLENW
jgi:hypothetical protein